MGVQFHGSAGEAVTRDWRQAIMRGLRGHCPRCGEGRLFRAFLKPVDRCESCGEELHHQRADDLPLSSLRPDPWLGSETLGHP